jgi:hypothetical protein
MNYELHVCECEQPGDFNCAVPGVLAAMEGGRLAPHAVVERCDQCCRFESDAAARARLVELGLADALDQDLKPFTVHCFAVVRIRFPGVLATCPKEAAKRAMERLDWDAHGRSAEFADEVTGALVDVDGDDDHLFTVEFDGQLQEVRK